MKTKTKIEKLLFVVITAFLLFSCEKELYEDSIKKDYNGKTEILIGKEAEKVALRLKNILGSRSTLDNGSLARTITLDIGTINYDEIVKIIDTYGKENYTFEIRYPIEDDKKFGNLILQEKDNYTTVKLIEYYMTDAFAQEYKLNYDLKQFQGNIKFIPIYTDNPCPDPELIVQIGNISYGGGSIGNPINPIGSNPLLSNGGHGIFMMGGANFSVEFTDGANDSGEDNTDVPNWIIWNPPTFGKLSIDPITPTDPTTPEDPCPQTTEIGILYPVDKCSKTFLEHLDNTSRKWLYTHNEVHNDIMNYIKNSPNCDEANEFALQFITQSYLNQNLTLDFEASKKSPANIDLSNVQGTTEAEKKFRCVYEKLTQSGGFKNLFLNTFGDNNRINVKFEVSSELPVGNNGRCEMTVAPDGSYNNLIQINSNLLDGSISNIIIAKTILHECIHAYLNIKRMNCNLGSTIPELNNLDLQELISLFYQNFNCHINVNGVPQSQHVFMLDYLTPTFINILNEVKGLLISQNHTQQLNNQVYYYPNSNLSESFNWNDFFYNLSLNGLNNTSAFQTNIQSDSIKYSKYLFYSSLFNMVTKECQ